jgi:hypothetical protein
MGQYYVLLNLTKRQYFADEYMTAGKMWEILYNLYNKPFVARALVELPNSPAASAGKAPRLGSWSGDRLVIIGDYSDEVPFFFTEAEKQELKSNKVKVESSSGGTEERAMNLYGFADEHYKAVGKEHLTADSTRQELARLFPKGKKTHHLVLNLDRKEYLDPTAFKEPASSVEGFARLQHGVMQGLFSQLCYSSGSGGGDVEVFMTGRWAGQRIAIREKEKIEDLDSWRDISERVVEDIEEYVLND